MTSRDSHSSPKRLAKKNVKFLKVKKSKKGSVTSRVPKSFTSKFALQLAAQKVNVKLVGSTKNLKT